MKKPMLLSNDEFELENLDYTNMYISKKRDGIRAEVLNEGIYNRSFKKLRNYKVQEWFEEIYSELPDGIIIEAEVYANGMPCRTIAGICNSKGHDIPKELKLYVFGIMNDELNFENRMLYLKKTMININSDKYKIVEQFKVNNHSEAQHCYENYLDKGYEGAVLMDGEKMYKHNRVTIRQHLGFKLKPHRYDDLEIIGVNERFENTNESQTNELGHSFKRNTVGNKKATGIAATFDCKLPNGKESKVNINGNEAFRRKVWDNQEDYIGCYAVVKSMDYGIKTRLRHPRLISIKDGIEK